MDIHGSLHYSNQLVKIHKFIQDDKIYDLRKSVISASSALLLHFPALPFTTPDVNKRRHEQAGPVQPFAHPAVSDGEA
jgi:hypothetical protein